MVAAKNEDEESDSGPGDAHGGTTDSVFWREAEAQHEEDRRSGTAEKDGGDSCTVEGGAGAISVLPQPSLNSAGMGVSFLATVTWLGTCAW